MAERSDKLIGYCGYNCHLCAARSEDIAVRQKLVDAWRKYLGHEQYTPENVYCVGCKNEGPHPDKECKARSCAIEKGLESCALCDEFPCDKMRHLMAIEKGMLFSDLKISVKYQRKITTSVCDNGIAYQICIIPYLKQEGSRSG